MWNNGYNSFTGNIVYVTSLEDALSRNNMPNTENVYFHQDKFTFYRVKVDWDGRKYWQEFSYDAPKQVDRTPVSKQDLSVLEERIKNIENMLGKGVNYEQSNGQVSTEPNNW